MPLFIYLVNSYFILHSNFSEGKVYMTNFNVFDSFNENNFLKILEGMA